MELTVKDIRNEFIKKFNNNDFVQDKSGVQTIELNGVSFIADEETIFGKMNYEYANREIEWYESQSLYVDDIPGKTPAIWEQVSSRHNEINSNYGWCVYSEDNYAQFDFAIKQLLQDKNSRRACMIYNRPSMTRDYNKDGMSDYMCTFATQQLIRDNKLIYIVFQRSMDVVFGYKNDRYWAYHVAKKMIKILQEYYPELNDEPIIKWQCGSVHLYDRHFKFINENGENN